MAFAVCSSIRGSRQLPSSPLALGIGAEHRDLQRCQRCPPAPLAVPRSAQLVTLFESKLQSGTEEAVTAGNFLDWRAQSQAFEAMAAYRFENFSATGNDRPERIVGLIANSSLFSVLEGEPAAGPELHS